MKVKELIEALQKCNPEYEVKYDDYTVDSVMETSVKNIVGTYCDEVEDSCVELR